MSPNTMTWVFLGGGIVWAGWYLWRQMRRPQADASRPNSPYSEPQPKPAPDQYAYDRPEPQYSQASSGVQESVAAPGYAVSQLIEKASARSVDQSAGMKWESAEAGSDQYVRTATFESLVAGRKQDRLPQIEPADLPTTDPSDYVVGPMTATFSALFPETEARQLDVRKGLRHAGE